MLADDVMAAVGGKFDRGTFGAVTAFAADLRSAHRFVFDANTCAAMAQVSDGHLTSVVKAIEVSRAPFPSCWIEWCPRDWGERRSVGICKAKRIGALLRCFDDTCANFECSFAWVDNFDGLSNKGADVAISPFCFVVNLQSEAVSNIDTYNARAFTNAFPADSEGREAARLLFTHYAPATSRYMAGYINKMTEELGLHQTNFGLKNCLQDILWEAPRILTALAFLNSKNCIQNSENKLDALNKARKRSGKRELLSYSEVKIDLSKRETVKAARLNLTSAEIRQHIVRGHFKVRKGGIYWWRPFLRGSSEIGKVMRKGYRVEGAPVLEGVAA